MIEKRPQAAFPKPHRVILSGCSSAGKSSILDALKLRGYAVVPEAGRQVVREELDAGGHALPWADASTFVERAVARAIHQFENVPADRRHVIFDRAVIDLVSFLEYKRLPVPQRLHNALRSYRYSRTVLIAPPWREIYVDDGERRKSFEQAIGEYEVLARWYRNEGYSLLEVPKDDVEERADFCERHLRTLKP
ncbi:MAG TPA: AAA family ATPase [Pararhizobium sp.]|nr:AAA family ATPase [Pararhizobium sp.]